MLSPSLTNTGKESAAVGFRSFLVHRSAIVNERSALTGSLHVGHGGEVVYMSEKVTIYSDAMRANCNGSKKSSVREKLTPT